MRYSFKRNIAIAIFLSATLAGCGSSESAKDLNSESTFPLEFLGIADSTCYGKGSPFFPKFEVKNISNRQISMVDVEKLGLFLDYRDGNGNLLVSLPIDFYGLIDGDLSTVGEIEPLDVGKVGLLNVADDGYKGTLETLEIRVNNEIIYSASISTTDASREGWIIKDGNCGY
jgi:hypothetical protein